MSEFNNDIPAPAPGPQDDGPAGTTFPQGQGGEPDMPNGRELYKLLIDGEETEVDLETLKKGYSHQAAASKRMSEAAKLKTDAERLLGVLRKDPLAVLKELDPQFDIKDYTSKQLARLIDEEMMTPEQKQAIIDQAELNEYRAKKAAEKEEVEKRQLQESMNVEIQNLDREFAAAFEQAGLPKTDVARRRLATMMLEAEESGMSGKYSVVEMAKRVKQEMTQELMELLSQTEGDQFEQILGSELLTKAQKVALAKVKTPGQKTEPRATPREPKEPSAGKGRQSSDDFFSKHGIFR